MKRDGSQAGKEEKRPCGGREQRGQKAGDRCGKRKKKKGTGGGWREVELTKERRNKREKL